MKIRTDQVSKLGLSLIKTLHIYIHTHIYTHTHVYMYYQRKLGNGKMFTAE